MSNQGSTRAGTAVRLVRISAGNHQARFRGHVYDVQRVRSDYGDWQWVIDRDGKLFSSADTLPMVRRYIEAYGTPVSERDVSAGLAWIDEIGRQELI
jgi:hypothetical protein